MPLSDLFARKREKISLLVDIGAGSVTGAFVSYPPGQVPKLLSRATLSYTGASAEGADTTQEMSDCLDKMLTQLFAHHQKISDVSVMFSAPWCAVETKQIHIEQNKKFIITQSFLDDIVRVESDKFQKELHTRADDGAGLSGDVKVIEEHLLHTQVNGYVVTQSVGMKTNVFDLSVHLGCVGQAVFDAVVKTIFHHTHLSHEKIHPQTFYFASYSVMYSLFPIDYVYMDVRGEATTILLVQNGLPAGTVSFPSGVRFVVQKVATTCKVSDEIAMSMIHTVFSGNADDELSQKVKTVMEDVEKEWAIYFEDALVSLSPRLALPSKVFLFAPADFAPLYQEFLSLAKTDATAVYRKSMHVTPVTPDMFAERFTNNPREPFDAHIAISSIFSE